MCEGDSCTGLQKQTSPSFTLFLPTNKCEKSTEGKTSVKVKQRMQKCVKTKDLRGGKKEVETD